jgi:hypothetical protein
MSTHRRHDDAHKHSGFLWLVPPILQANARLALLPNAMLYSPVTSKVYVLTTDHAN